jgi:hypothetical protein
MLDPTTNPATVTIDRKVWHSLVEIGVRAAMQRGGAVDVDKLLNSVGLFSWAPHRTQAHEYAMKLLDAGGAA